VRAAGVENLGLLTDRLASSKAGPPPPPGQD